MDTSGLSEEETTVKGATAEADNVTAPDAPPLKIPAAEAENVNAGEDATIKAKVEADTSELKLDE